MPSKRKSDDTKTSTNKKIKVDENSANVYYERWDFDRLSAIAELTLDPQTEAVVHEVYTELKTTGKTRLKVSYKPTSDFKEGRVYGKGLQGTNGAIRRLCAGDFYHDLDMVNCAPNLLKQILQKHGVCPVLLQEYVEDRSGVFERVRISDERLRDVSDDVLKKVFLLGIHGGTHLNYLQKYLNFPEDDTAPVSDLKAWEKCLRKSLKVLRK